MQTAGRQDQMNDMVGQMSEKLSGARCVPGGLLGGLDCNYGMANSGYERLRMVEITVNIA